MVVHYFIGPSNMKVNSFTIIELRIPILIRYPRCKVQVKKTVGLGFLGLFGSRWVRLPSDLFFGLAPRLSSVLELFFTSARGLQSGVGTILSTQAFHNQYYIPKYQATILSSFSTLNISYN